jgi:aerobic-type carbon monoxide dehydrogenase small subunit (CoxS/CutS family)
MTNICRCGTYPRVRAALQEARAAAAQKVGA